MRRRRLRSDRPRRHQQPLHAAQEPARPGDRDGKPAAGDRLRRVRRRRPAAPEGDLRARRRQLPQPDPQVGGGHPDDRARDRQLDRRRRLPAGHVRLHGDGARAGPRLPRRPAAGQDGDRRGGRGGGARRRRDALADLRRLRVHRRRRGRRSADRARDRPQPELAQARPRAARQRRRSGPRSRGAARDRLPRPADPVRRPRGDRPHRRRLALRRVQARLRDPARRPAGPSCTAGRSRSSPTTG